MPDKVISTLESQLPLLVYRPSGGRDHKINRRSGCRCVASDDRKELCVLVDFMAVGNNEGAVLLRIHLTDSYAASTTIKITNSTIADDVCQAISVKLGVSENDKIFDSLICVVNGFDGKTVSHWMKTLKKSDNILQFQATMLKKRAALVKNPDLLNSLTTSWYYKDIRSVPLQLDGDISGNSSSDDEQEISLNDLIYFGSGDRRAVLFKRSSRDHNLWRKRLCLLNDKLWCINLKKKAPYATCIHLNGKVMSQEAAPDLNYPNGIIIQIPNQVTYFLRTNSLSEQSIWKEELQDRAAYGIENAVLYMGEMITCDEEQARGLKKHQITSASLQREAIWRALKESAQILDTQRENDLPQEAASLNNPDSEGSNGFGNGMALTRKSECSVEEDPEESAPTIISYGLDEGFESSAPEESERRVLNADEAFIHRDPQARMDAYIKYRSSYGISSDSASLLNRHRPVSRRITTLRNSSPRPQNARGLMIDVSLVVPDDITPALSGLPCAPIRCVHSFHCHFPHISAALTLIDAIHGFKGAFRHDLHLTPRTLWALALKIYFSQFHRFVQTSQSSSQCLSSPWAVTVKYLQLHLPGVSPNENSALDNQVAVHGDPSPFSPQESEIFGIFKRLKASLISNLQTEVPVAKRSVKKPSTQSSTSYWFWPSEEDSLFRREERHRSTPLEAEHLSVGYGMQLVDPHLRPQIFLFDELLAGNVLFPTVEEGGPCGGVG